ncbi:hypothetical protein ABIC65_003712 [Sphingomonas trueperi]|uniref:hypothetical protein n=1 Tax=Sphingomonas trueperi TaxID=53317 RepID=UPI003392D56C
MAVALLTERDIARCGDALSRCYRLDDSTDFDGLLRLIDQADDALQTRIPVSRS